MKQVTSMSEILFDILLMKKNWAFIKTFKQLKNKMLILCIMENI